MILTCANEKRKRESEIWLEKKEKNVSPFWLKERQRECVCGWVDERVLEDEVVIPSIKSHVTNKCYIKSTH
jgi:hypothetical protein